MQNVFNFRNDLITSYSSFSRSFTRIAATDIGAEVERAYGGGRYWPEPLIQINPNYQRAANVHQLMAEGILHPGCDTLFRVGQTPETLQPLQLFKHQMEAVTKARQGRSYVVTTGTGSGKSLSFFLPIVDHILRAKEKDPTPRTRAIIIYPMNALANSQVEEMGKFLKNPEANDLGLTIARYTGQESDAERRLLAANPPDILLTNFMMLELILTRFDPEVDSKVVRNCEGLDFLVLDELHTYRGRQGADVAMLVRRLRQRLKADHLLCIGTSATMSSSGTADDRKRTVASVSSRLFGADVTPEDVIGETLERTTNPSLNLAAVKPALASRLNQPSTWADVTAFRNDPLAVWAELTLGLKIAEQAQPERARPISASEAVSKLAADAGVHPDKARLALEQFLIAAQEITTADGRALFAFKLHQFISGPGKVLCTLEADDERKITLDAQRFAPGRQAEGVMLFNTHFCRECGQEYHPVWETLESAPHFTPREIDDVGSDDQHRRFGFLMPVRPGQDYQGHIEDLPDSWLETAANGEPRLKDNYKKQHAQPMAESIDARGHRDGGRRFWFISGKFRFCLCCGHEHTAHGRDINRLSSLSGEGRSSATTILTLALLRQHFASPPLADPSKDFRKLLGFTDNRQDAALQAGHFNDFLYLLLIRSGLLAALRAKGGSLQAGDLGVEVFRALGFETSDEGILAEYLQEPETFGLNKEEADRAARFVLGYRLLRDLRKGWRYNNPNLTQLKLVEIDFRGLDDLSSRDALFAKDKEPENLSPAAVQGWSLVRSMPPPVRAGLGRLIFEAMLRDLCVESEYLDPTRQESAKAAIFSHLNERWAFGQDEKLSTTKYLILDKRPETKGKQKRDDLIGGGPRSRLVREIRYSKLFPQHDLQNVPGEVLVEAVRAFLSAAAKGGYVTNSQRDKSLTGWALKDTALVWKLNPPPAEPDVKINAFFRDLYTSVAEMLGTPGHYFFDFEAHEHTAQVDSDRRKVLEARFRQSDLDKKWWKDSGQKGPLVRLPVLYCSPTMELGVDISALNTVYMRNVPPTPANYAQRSGRAGRSGQAALVVTYSAAMSPHDQWFFHHAEEMVHGVVKPPTLDLTNRNLIDSHLHAVWLAAVQKPIDTSIAPLLDLNTKEKPLQSTLHEAIHEAAVQNRALSAAKAVISQVESELAEASWYFPEYVANVIEQSPGRFAEAFDRWRELYDATHRQMTSADGIVKSPATSPAERENAKRRYLDAANQLRVLLKTGGGQNNDFYTFRYLASQGFLPGYNFPRLPLMAWIPATGRKQNVSDDAGNMVSRPRFLALSEFGPRSLIYHQGRMFRVVRAKLNVTAADHITSDSKLATLNALVCTHCGYGHLGRPEDPEPKHHVCDKCGEGFSPEARVNELYRIETVETKPVERISANDEERQRQGFDIITTYRFLSGPGGQPDKLVSSVKLGEEEVASLTYSPSASLWRINRGWKRRKDKKQLGFYINPLSGLWSKQDDAAENEGDEDDSPEEATSNKIASQRIVPFVEDHRNILILTPDMMPKAAMATIQAALKRGIEQAFQIESSELVVEALPTSQDRRSLLFYEAAEGGAGVLNRLATDRTQLAQIARIALELMHYKVPASSFVANDLEDLAGAQAGEKAHPCEAGCYQCLLSYFNQPDHEIIDRRNTAARNFLASLANGTVEPFHQEITAKSEAASSDATSLWLQEVTRLGLRKPDKLAVPINGGESIAAAAYQSARALIFLTPPSEEAMAYAQDRGFTIIVFPPDMADWPAIFATHSAIFGTPSSPA